MRKIGMIIQREYWTRVRKRSFILLTLLAPFLMILIILIPLWVSQQGKTVQKILINDQSHLFENLLKPNEYHQISYSQEDIRDLLKKFYQTDYNVLLFIPENIIKSNVIQLYYKKQPGLATETYLKGQIEEILTSYKLIKNNIQPETIERTKTRIKLITEKINEKGQRFETYSAINIFIGFLLAIIIYIFIFVYASMVMRGVMEEKTSRIVEVIISSVRPFELMMGKIIGIALVALTQFLIWMICILILYPLIAGMWLKEYDQALKTNQMKQQILLEKGPSALKGMETQSANIDKELLYMYGSFKNIDFYAIFLSFAFYFLFGYLLYGSLFAAIGAAADNETDTQQFILPVSAPLIIAFIIAQSLIENPESSLSFLFSLIPLTSPIVMMIRLPFGVPLWELLLSMALVILGFILCTMIAAKVYRTAILLYGQKVTWKDMWKWVKQ